jgi:hypothetical protein
MPHQGSRGDRRLVPDYEIGDMRLIGSRTRVERRARGVQPAGRRAVDARVGPARLPAIQIRLGRVEGLETETFQRRLLGVADAGFDFPFAIGIADPAREGDHPVMREHIAIERIQRRVVDVRGEDPFFQIVEDDDADGTAQPAKGAFMELGPDLRTRAPHEQPHGFARAAQRQDEERVRRYFPVLRSRTIGPPSP